MGKFKKSHGAGGFRGGSGFGKKTFDRPRFGGKPGGFGGGRRGSNYGPARSARGGGEREMFPATCGNCGKPCEVPFRPTGDRPVFCSDCFHKRDEGGGFLNRDSFRPASTMASEGERRQPQMEGRPGKSLAELERQMAAMNAKVDKMLAILESVQEAADEEMESEEEVVVPDMKEQKPKEKRAAAPPVPNKTSGKKKKAEK